MLDILNPTERRQCARGGFCFGLDSESKSTDFLKKSIDCVELGVSLCYYLHNKLTHYLISLLEQLNCISSSKSWVTVTQNAFRGWLTHRKCMRSGVRTWQISLRCFYWKLGLFNFFFVRTVISMAMFLLRKNKIKLVVPVVWVSNRLQCRRKEQTSRKHINPCQINFQHSDFRLSWQKWKSLAELDINLGTGLEVLCHSRSILSHSACCSEP